MSGLGFKPCRIMPKNKKSPKREAKEITKLNKRRFSIRLTSVGNSDREGFTGRRLGSSITRCTGTILRALGCYDCGKARHRTFETIG